MPARIVGAVPVDAQPPGALSQSGQLLHRTRHLALAPHDADQVLHHPLQFMLDAVTARAVIARLALERRQRGARRSFHLARVDLPCATIAGEARRVRAGALAEDEQVGERVPAQPVRSMQAGGALAGREQPGHAGHLRLRVDSHSPHHVMRGGTDLHRLPGDVDVRQLEKLVIHAGQLLLDHLFGIGQPALDPGDVEEDAAVRAPPPVADLAHDAAGDVIAREQLRRPARALVALGVAPPLLLVARGLALVVLGDVVEEEAPAFLVEQHAALAAHALGDEDALHAGRPDHPGGMELDELHVHQLGAGVVGERVAVARVLPAVAGDPISLADSAGGDDDRARPEEVEQPFLAVVAESAADALAVLEQGDDGEFHVHVDALVDAVIL